MGEAGHLDGHETTGKQALRMGDIGLLIYDAQDKFSGSLRACAVHPDVRTAETIAQQYPDLATLFIIVSTSLLHTDHLTDR
jgi:hypothetical protein